MTELELERRLSSIEKELKSINKNLGAIIRHDTDLKWIKGLIAGLSTGFLAVVGWLAKKQFGA